jgi:nitrite reductase/ring-hydroxylating ferredoxin subunit
MNLEIDSHSHYVKAVNLEDIPQSDCHVVYLEGRAIALFRSANQIYAIDNRCPHMGFPLHKGTVQDGILTCHWHHARFDLFSGGTFDPWADDVQTFPVDIRGTEVWVDLAPQIDPQTHHQQRLLEGLKHNISLVIAKAVLALLGRGEDPIAPFDTGIAFGSRYRRAGWGAGLTILTCMANVLSYLDAGDRPKALYHGLSAVASDCAGQPPRFEIEPLPTITANFVTLKRWFRQFVEVRDTAGAERCLISAIRSNASPAQVAEMLFAAATDHRFLDGGHTLDFTNKALEALDITGWQAAEPVLGSLIRGYTQAERMEESSAWRYPINLIEILDRAFAVLPDILQETRPREHSVAVERESLIKIVLADDPQAIADTLLEALRQGYGLVDLAAVVSYAATLRIAQFNTSNDYRDWDTAHHTFTFANAVHQGLRRVPSPELARGLFDAAMRVYLNRFLNMPAVSLPIPQETVPHPERLLHELSDLLDRQQQVDAAGRLVAQYLYSGGEPERLLAELGKLLLREDRSFHTIQTVEASFRQYSALRGTDAGNHVLIAAARYLAAHAPTARSQGQTYSIAERLYHGDRLFE